MGCSPALLGLTAAAREPIGRSRVLSPSTPKMEAPMNWDQVKGNWKQVKGEAQKQWGKLTNDDLDVIAGERTKLSGRIQELYGYAKDRADREVDDWLSMRH
jgi:uncharacterized protein YjbJ (UPF0337 family)